MVLVKEYRIPLPLDINEYARAQLYTTTEVSKDETKNSDAGVVILKNEPYDDPEHGKGQYTKKIYHLGSRMPRFVTMLAPSSALQLEEEAWNGYPYIKTVLTNPFLGERFKLEIITKHSADMGEQANIHNLDEKTLALRSVEFLDIAEKVDEKDYKPEQDPTKYHSTKTGRGPLKEGWRNDDPQPHMCAYKLIIMKFHVLGLDSRVENFVSAFQKKMFTSFHRRMYCLIDQWFDLTMEDIREIEAKLKEELDAVTAQKLSGKPKDEDVDAKKKKMTV